MLPVYVWPPKIRRRDASEPADARCGFAQGGLHRLAEREDQVLAGIEPPPASGVRAAWIQMWRLAARGFPCGRAAKKLLTAIAPKKLCPTP